MSDTTPRTTDTPPHWRMRLRGWLRSAAVHIAIFLAVLLGIQWLQTRHMPIGVTAPDIAFARLHTDNTADVAPPATQPTAGTAHINPAPHTATQTAPDGAPHLTPHAAQPLLHTTLAEWRHPYAGQPVVLYFWASWCSICRLEQPLISDFVGRYPVLPIALRSGSAAQVAAYEQRHGLHWNSALDPDGTLAAAFGVRGTPAFIVLDANGHISSRTLGMTTPWGLRLRLWQARW